VPSQPLPAAGVLDLRDLAAERPRNRCVQSAVAESRPPLFVALRNGDPLSAARSGARAPKDDLGRETPSDAP
jgi:hypothetical protein